VELPPGPGTEDEDEEMSAEEVELPDGLCARGIHFVVAVVTGEWSSGGK
jgi:hypothetical protein